MVSADHNPNLFQAPQESPTKPLPPSCSRHRFQPPEDLDSTAQVSITQACDKFLDATNQAGDEAVDQQFDEPMVKFAFKNILFTLNSFTIDLNIFFLQQFDFEPGATNILLRPRRTTTNDAISLRNAVI